MSLVYFVCPIVCLQGAVQMHLSDYCAMPVDIPTSPNITKCKLPLWDLHPPRTKEKAEIRDYIVATENDSERNGKKVSCKVQRQGFEPRSRKG